MRAPDIIYTDGMNTCATLPVFSNIDSNIKYIRADLAGLTWEDIRELFKIADNYESELNRPKYLTQGYCKEILSRFMESKKATRL